MHDDVVKTKESIANILNVIQESGHDELL
jgi:hypothetical protein